MATTKTKSGSKSAPKPAASAPGKPAGAPGGKTGAKPRKASSGSGALAYKPGQTLSITLTKEPRSEAMEKTLLRLMRMDAGIKRALKSGHDERMGRLHIRSRGGRPWEVREKSARIARVEKGRTFSLKFYPGIGPDLAVAAPYIAVKAG